MKEGWQIKRLGEICDIARGGSPRPIQKYLTDRPDGVNWIKIGDATASIKYIYKTEEKIKPDGVKRSRLVKEGDFLLSNSMSFGRPYIMRTTGCIHDGWLVLSDKSGSFDQDYLYYFLGSFAAYKQFDALAAGSTVRNLNIDLVKRVEVPLPSIFEQKRIVAILEEVLAALTTATVNTEKNLKSARELFDSYLDSIFMRKTEGWVEKRLGDVVTTISTGPFGSLLHKSDYVKGGTPIVNPTNIVEGRIIADLDKTLSDHTVDRLRNYKLSKGDIVIARRGEIGRCAVVQAEQSGWMCGTGCFIVKVPNDVDSSFLAGLLRSKDCARNLEQISTGTTMKNLSNSALHNFVVSMPPVADQIRFDKLFDELSSEISKVETVYQQKLSRLADLRQSILEKAFSGELTSPPSTVIKEAAE